MFHLNEEFILVYPSSQVLQTFEDFVSVMKQGNADICFSLEAAAQAKARLGNGYIVIKCKGRVLENVTEIVNELINDEGENEDETTKVEW